MTLNKLRLGDVLAGLGGLALLVVMFFPWFELLEGVQDGGRIVSPTDTEQTAWESFGPLLVLLVLSALLGLTLFATTAFERTSAWPVAAQVFGAFFGTITLVWLLIRLLDEPGPDFASDIAWGGWAGLAAVVAIFLGTWLSMREEERP
jgi:heme A synthase